MLDCHLILYWGKGRGNLRAEKGNQCRFALAPGVGGGWWVCNISKVMDNRNQAGGRPCQLPENVVT